MGKQNLPDERQTPSSESGVDARECDEIASGDSEPVAVPIDFMPVGEGMPTWIDISGVCKEAKRFVALHALSQFNAVAINDGQRVFPPSDRDGEFRRFFRRVRGARVADRRYA